MNELHLNNPMFIELILHLEQDVERRAIFIDLALPIIDAPSGKKKRRDEVFHLITHDNIWCQTMVWKTFPLKMNQFFSLDCFDNLFLKMTRGTKYVDKKQILCNE
jgi:hypothetical protein